MLGVARAGEELPSPVWNGEFRKEGPLEGNGWLRVRHHPGDRLEAMAGEARIHCSHAPHKGTLYAIEVPCPSAGMLEYEVFLNEVPGTPGVQPYMPVSMGNITLVFRNHHIGRIIQGRGYKKIAENQVVSRQWMRMGISWDGNGTISYYAGDMRNPLFSEAGEAPRPALGDDGRFLLKFGNYGLRPEDNVHRIRKFRILKIHPRREADGVSKRDTLLIFRGPTADARFLAGFMEKFPGLKNEVFTLDFRGACQIWKNNMALSRLPNSDIVSRASVILLADMPFSEKAFPATLQEMLVAEIQKGARLFIAGGPFSLNKGEMGDSPLAKVLPCKAGSPWDVDFNTVHAAGIAYATRHRLAPKANAKVLYEANGHPMLIYSKLGKGDITVAAPFIRQYGIDKGESLYDHWIP